MSNLDGDDEQDRARQLPSSTPEPLAQSLLPNLDRMSRDGFRKGTYSRRRIVRSGIALVVVFGAVAAIIWATWPGR